MYTNNAVLPQSPGGTRTRRRLTGRAPRNLKAEAGLDTRCGPPQGSGGRPPLDESARVPALIAQFEEVSRGNLLSGARARSPDSELESSHVISGVTKRRRSGISTPPTSVTDACTIIANHGELQSFIERRENGHKSDVAKAVCNLVGGHLALHSLVQYVLERESDVSIRLKIAEQIADVTASHVNSEPTSALRVIKTPPLAKLAAFRSDLGLSNFDYKYGRKHFPEVYNPLYQVIKFEKQFLIECLPEQFLIECLGH
jgi:hypothetical protein